MELFPKVKAIISGPKTLNRKNCSSVRATLSLLWCTSISKIVSSNSRETVNDFLIFDCRMNIKSKKRVTAFFALRQSWNDCQECVSPFGSDFTKTHLSWPKSSLFIYLNLRLGVGHFGIVDDLPCSVDSGSCGCENLICFLWHLKGHIHSHFLHVGMKGVDIMIFLWFWMIMVLCFVMIEDDRYSWHRMIIILFECLIFEIK